jgi:hypothetical protein
MAKASSMPYMISDHHFQLFALAGDLVIKSTGESSLLFSDVGDRHSRICSPLRFILFDR